MSKKQYTSYAQSRNWAFTDWELLDIEEIFKSSDDIRYICWGEEVSPTTGNTHYQGWIQFTKKKRLGGVKKYFQSKKIHLETCRGSEIQNDKYCQKDGKWKTLGSFITQGHRSDLDLIRDSIKNGSSLKQVMDENFETYCKYRGGIRDYKAEHDKEARVKFRKIEVEYIYGTTGTGKTRYAMEKDPFKICADDLQWWDGYEGEKEILIDEYNNNIGVTKLLNLLDGYRLRLPIKGGFTYANWTKVYITSNLDPGELHEKAKERHREALFRRINKFIQIFPDGSKRIDHAGEDHFRSQWEVC